MMYFRITRNIDGTDVLVTPASNIWEGGIDIPKYDNNDFSTPEVAKLDGTMNPIQLVQ